MPSIDLPDPEGPASEQAVAFGDAAAQHRIEFARCRWKDAAGP